MNESYKNGDAGDSGPLKAIIYCRVASLVFPEKGLAIESREERCRAYAASRGYSIEKVVHDVAVSGLSQNRAGTNEILQFLANETDPGQYVVVIDDIGRLARSPNLYFDFKNAIAAAGARLDCRDTRNGPDSGYSFSDASPPIMRNGPQR